MKTLIEFLEAKGLTMADFEAKSPEEQVELIKELNNENGEAYKALKEKADANEDEIKKVAEELGKSQREHIQKVHDILTKQGYALAQIVEEKNTGEPVDEIKTQLTDNLEGLKAMKSGASKDGIQLKAPGTMQVSTNVTGDVPQSQRIAGLNTIASRRIRLFDLIPQAIATSDKVSWVYQANKDGSAGQTAEGAVKNQIDFDIIEVEETIKKTTAYIKVSKEMLDDISFMRNEINNELMREVLKAVESQVYSGDGTGQNLNGIKTTATAFAAGSFANTVDNANKVDVLRAAVNQIAIAEQDFPTAILMHPSDLTSLLFEKVDSTDKRYIMALQEIASNRTLDGIPIITTTLVTVDDYLIGDFNMATLYVKENMTISVGFENDDFTRNLVTILAEWRGLVVVKNNDRSAFVEGDFTTDQAALETP